MPAFFCLTNTNKTTNTKAGEMRSLEEKMELLILLWGKQSECVCTVVVLIRCVFQFLGLDAKLLSDKADK